MRVKMPDIQTAERWKRGRVVEVKTQAEADDLVAQGGTILEEPAKDHRAEPDPITTTKTTTKAHK